MDQKSLIDPALMESLGLEFDPKREARRLRAKAYSAAYYQEHKQQALISSRAWKAAHPELVKGYAKKARDSNRPNYRRISRNWQRKSAATLTDGYVRGVLRNQATKRFGRSLPMASFPQELVEAKRAELLLARKIKNRKLKHKGTHESQETQKPA